MGLFLDKPKREKTAASGEGNGLRYAVSAMQGWRVDMEDAHAVKIDLSPKWKNWSYFAVFDGHAGDFVSNYSAEHLSEEILEKFEDNELELFKDQEAMEQGTSGSDSIQHAAGASVTQSRNIQESGEKRKENEDDSTQKSKKLFSSTDSSNSNHSTKELADAKETCQMEVSSTPGPDSGTKNTQMVVSGTDEKSSNSSISSERLFEKLKQSTKQGFLNLDETLKELPQFVSGEERSGTTAIVTFVTPTHILFANCGDSRALLCRDGEIGFVTVDHKPYLEEEKTRIEQAGGSVIIQRVNGSLAVSRALGDFDYKKVPGLPNTQQLVSAEPEVTLVERHPKDEFLVLACDGVWDVMTSQEVILYIRSRLQVHQELQSVAEELLETCLAKGSKDNMSVVLVTLPGAPKLSNEALQLEAELDLFLRKKIEEAVKSRSGEDIDTTVILDCLQGEDIPGLPPGGGLQAKMNLIETILDELLPERHKNEAKQMATSIPVPLNVIRQITGGSEPEAPFPDKDQGPGSTG